MEPAAKDQILKMCRDVLAPMVRADGGEMYVVSLETDEIHIHLAGTCAGCPGASLTRDSVFEPALASIAPKLALKLTTGWRIPTGAQKID
jgi:Fe-S cluster biogenesis protein NfuA